MKETVRNSREWQGCKVHLSMQVINYGIMVNSECVPIVKIYRVLNIVK